MQRTWYIKKVVFIEDRGGNTEVMFDSETDFSEVLASLLSLVIS